MYTKGKEMPGPAAWTSYIRVEDVHATTKAIQAAGGRVINGPMEVPGGDWITMAIDPQGAMFAIHAKPKKAARPARKARKPKKTVRKATRKTKGKKAGAKTPKKVKRGKAKRRK
jgi:hypothetical protein